MKWTLVFSLLPALVLLGGIALGLYGKVRQLQGDLRQERAESRRLGELLQAGAQQAAADRAALRRLRHDLRHYLNLIDGSAPAGAAALLRDALNAPPPASDGEDWPVCVLVRRCLDQAKALGFQADLQIAVPPDRRDLIPDLCLVLSNLLENSMEALQREGGGWLRARSLATPGYLSLVVANTCTRPLQVLNGRYCSSKAEGRFGIGLATVEEVVRRYGGDVSFTADGQQFQASLFWPCPKTAAPGEEQPQPARQA